MGNAGITSDLLDWGALATAQDYWEVGQTCRQLSRVKARKVCFGWRRHPMPPLSKWWLHCCCFGERFWGGVLTTLSGPQTPASLAFDLLIDGRCFKSCFHKRVTSCPKPDAQRPLTLTHAPHVPRSAAPVGLRCCLLGPNRHQFTPFHRACSQGHGDVLVELLKAREPGIKGGRRGGEGEGGRVGSGRVVRAWGGGGSGNIGGSFTRGGGGSGNLSPTHGLRSEVVDIRNHFQATPLHRAAAKGHAEVGRLM